MTQGSREPQERNVPELASFPEKGRHGVGVLGLPALVLWVAEKGLLAERVAPPWIGYALQHQKERQRQWEGWCVRSDWNGQVPGLSLAPESLSLLT